MDNHRYSLNLGDKLNEDISAEAKAIGVSKNEYIRRALGSYVYLSRALSRDDDAKLIIEADGSVREIVLR